MLAVGPLGPQYSLPFAWNELGRQAHLGVDTLPTQRVPQKILKKKYLPILFSYFNRVMRMSLQNGDHIKTWRYSTMKAWNVNWESRHMMIQFEDDKNVIFQVWYKLDVGIWYGLFSMLYPHVNFYWFVSVSIRRLQGYPRVYRWLYIPLNEK